MPPPFYDIQKLKVDIIILQSLFLTVAIFKTLVGFLLVGSLDFDYNAENA